MSSHKLSLTQLASTLYQSGPPMLRIAHLQLSAVILIRGGFWEPLNLHLQEHWAWKRHGTAPALVSPHHSNVGQEWCWGPQPQPPIVIRIRVQRATKAAAPGLLGIQKSMKWRFLHLLATPTFYCCPRRQHLTAVAGAWAEIPAGVLVQNCWANWLLWQRTLLGMQGCGLLESALLLTLALPWLREALISGVFGSFSPVRLGPADPLFQCLGSSCVV